MAPKKTSKKSKALAKIDAAGRRIREAQRRLKKARVVGREAKKELVSVWQNDADTKVENAKTRKEFSDFMVNVVDELELHQIFARYRIVKNKDMTIDAEIRVPYPDTVDSIDKATDVLNVLEETLDRVPFMQHISVGFTLAPEVNKEGIRASALQYVKYQGELRLNPNYYDTASGQPVAFQVAYDVLRNVVKSHKRLPTGMLIRFAWSPDGWLHRTNDYELRKKL